MPRLIRIDWPDFGTPALPPDLTLSELRARLAAFRAAGAGYEVLVVYGDREHAANIQWLTGFDPRFEETLPIVTATDALLRGWDSDWECTVCSCCVFCVAALPMTG